MTSHSKLLPFFLAMVCFWLIGSTVVLGQQTDTAKGQTKSLPDSLPAADSLAVVDSTASTTAIPQSTSLVNADSAALISLSDSAKARQEGTPVLLHGKRLFTLYSNLGEYTPRQRAERIVKATEDLIDSDQPLDSLSLSHGKTISIILLGNQVLASVTNEDAEAQHISRQQLAQQNAQQLKATIAGFREESSTRRVLINLGISVLMTIVLIALFRLITYLFRKIATQFIQQPEHPMAALRVKGIELLTSESVTKALLLLNRTVAALLKVVVFYAYLTLVLGLFVRTKTWAASLLSLVLDPAKIMFFALLGYIPNLITILVIIFIFRLLMRLASTIFDNIANEKLVVEGFFKEWAGSTKRIVNLMLIIFALIVIYPYSPIAKSAAAQGVSLFLGIVFSLGSSTAISNMVASILLTYTRAFQLGDRIRIGEVTGDIIEKNSLVTRIRTIKNEEVSVPNATMLNSNITNYSEAIRRGEGIIMHTTVTIGYDVPWRQVHQLLTTAASATEGILPQPPPFVLQTGLQDYYPSYELNAYTNQPGRMAGIYSLLHANIQDQFNAAGVEILSPQYTALRDGNASTIPVPIAANGEQPTHQA